MMEDNTYKLSYLMDRVYQQLEDSKPEKTRLKLVKPVVNKMNKKTFFENFVTTCQSINRNVIDVQRFFEAELATSTSVSGDNKLVIQGMFKPKDVCTILINFIQSHVICKECKSHQTELIKEKRISYIKCNVCMSQKAI